MIEYLLSLSLLIAVVLLIRAVFRKTVSPRVTYALWLLVVIRMMVPVTLFEADVTLYNYLQNWQTEQAEQTEEMPEDSEEISEENVQSPGTELQQTTPTYPSQNTTPVTPAYPPSTPFIPATPTVPSVTTPAAPIVPETEAEPPILSEDVIPEVPEEPAIIHWQRIANLVWFIGAVVIAVWVFCTAVIYNRRLVKNRILHRTVRGTKVYVSEDASVPCISGLIPSIYITPEAANSKSEMLIIIHEHVHLRHGDHIWAFIRALALIVFWYNPLVWAAATVSKLDAELACDDAISAKLNDATRLKYAHILLDTIPQKHRYATGLGSAPMKERILMLTKRQKNRGICLILALVLAVSAVGCSFIGARKITMDRIQEHNGFTILSQERKEITLILPLEQLPTYNDIVSAEGARLELKDIPVFTTDTTEVFLHTVGVSGHEPEGVDKDKLYLGFDIRHSLTDSGTVYTVNRVMNENGSNTYSPEVSVTEETLEDYERKILHMGSGPNDQFYLYIDADLYTALQGDLNIGITLNEIVYERGDEVKTYGLNAAEDDMSELDPEDQQTETFISMDAYVTDRMAKETTAQYYTYGPDGKSISSQSMTANVIDTKLLRLEKKGELAGLATEGILECWEYEYLLKLDVPAEEIIPVGGQYGEDGWFDLTGQGNHITVALRYPDDTYMVLRDTCVGDGIDFMGYHNTYEEAIYDWYVKEYALDLPLYVQDWADKITVPNGEHIGNQPVHRFDGDGWSIYIPLSAWYLSTDAGENEWIWHSSYLTGSTLLVEAFSDAMESETLENIQTDGTYSHTYDYDNPNGGFWRVTISWTEEGITDYPYIAIEPQLLKLMAESFIVLDEESADSKALSQGPFIGFVESKETPWIQLYTEKDGIYVGRIPYEIFHDWVATDRDSEGWSPGWQPEYMHFYYAEFDDFRWAAAHLTNTVMGSGRKNVATSTDGGNTWNVGSTADDYGGNHVVGIAFASESIAFMSFDPYNEHDGADGPIISRTIDGGKTWELLDISVPPAFEGKKLIAGIPYYNRNDLFYPIWLNTSHGTKEGEPMYLVSRDKGFTWSWDSYSLPAEATQYVVDIPMEDERDFITVAGVYGKGAEPNYPDGATIHAGKDGTLYYVMGVGNDGWSRGNFKALRTYRVTSKSGYLESVEEVETFTKDKVLKNGKPYTGYFDGMFTCQAYRFRQGNFNYDFLSHTVYIQSDGTICANSGLVGTGGPIGYEGTYQYDVKTGDFSTKLIGRYANEGEVTIYPEAEVKGKLYEYGGFVHFVCESSGIHSLTVKDPIPLTFVPNTDGYATPEAVILDDVFDGVWEGCFDDGSGDHLYRLSIITETAQIQFDDIKNDSSYVGTYTVNPLNYTQTAKLRSLNASAKEEEFTIKFSLGYVKGVEETWLYFDIRACDAPSLQHIAGYTLVFEDNTAISTAYTTENIFSSILENQQYFYDVSSKESMLLSEYKAETDYSVKKYTILDLNADRDPEMVLWLGHGTDDYAGFLVLHRDGNTVYAHGFPYRGFNGLNGDGVYTSSSSAFNISILKLDFNGDTCTETVLARREGDGSPESVTYYIEDRIGTAEEFEKCLSRYNSRGIPDWYSYDIEEITDIDDWHTLLWAEGLPDDENRQPSQNVFSFIRDLVKGESEIPEINRLGIKDYSIALLKDSAYDSLFRFTFTVTGDSLPQTLLPGTYTWMLLDGMELSIYTEGIPATQEEAEAYWKRMRGLERFEGNSAVEAVNTYLSWMPYIYEVSPYGKWDPENYHLPYNYICAYYGNEGHEISFDELQSLMSEKFGITVDRPTAEPFLLSRCKYNAETDTVYYADTRGYEAVHRILDIREEDGITYVIVQLFADCHRMIPSHKLQFAIGEGEVFLRSEIIQNGNYDPREIS